MKGAILMGEQHDTEPADSSIGFWEQSFVLELPPKGKLALVYAMEQERDNELIIIEDMARHTAINPSECSDWLRRFIREGTISAALVGEAV